MLKLYDDTLRDGEQMAGLAFSPAHKLLLAQAIAGAGVPVMQAGYPAASRGDMLACAGLLRARREGRLPAALELVLLSRPEEDDLLACARACALAGEDPAKVSVLVLGAVSDLHLRHKLGRKLLARGGFDPHGIEAAPMHLLRRLAMGMAVEGIGRARALGFGLVEAACEDASRCDDAWVTAFALACRNAGAGRIAYCDTCGVLTPERVEAVIPALARALGVGRGRVQLAAHFHDDYGLAAANTVKAALCGATHLAVTLNGLGERSGNAALHRVVLPLRDLHGMALEGFQYRRLRSLSVLAEQVSGVLLPAHEPGVGRGAFRHESGLHVAALLEHPHTYQSLNPASVGGQMELVYGKHSGRSGVAAALGPGADPALVSRVLRRLKACTERKARQGVHRRGTEVLIRARDRMDQARLLGAGDIKALAGAVP